MIKKSNSISINILSVFVILISLLLVTITGTNAWFSTNQLNGVEIQVQINNLNLNVYQKELVENNNYKADENGKKLLRWIPSHEQNLEFETDDDAKTNAQYINLSGEIKPDVNVPLTLVLMNEDLGQTTMHIRFKFELYVRGVDADSEIITEISGFTAPGAKPGFVKANDGYYYYQNSSGVNQDFVGGTSVNLLTGFTVPYSSFVEEDGDMIIKDSNTVYIKLIVEAGSNF